MLLFLIATHFFMFLMIVAVNFIKPSLNIFSHSLNGRIVLINAANSYIIMLAVCAIQFGLGLRFRNFIAPIGIGLALWLTGTILVFQFKSDLAYYFPYSYQAFPLSQFKTQITQIAWTSFGYAIMFLLIGYFDFKRRRMN
jgi:hypothetical protein